MRTLSAITVFSLMTSGSLVACQQETDPVDPLDAYLATWMPRGSEANPISFPTEPSNPADGVDPGSKLDLDGDGVPAGKDCNDNSPLLGQLLYLDSLDRDTNWFHPPTQLSRDPWIYTNQTLAATGGGQQANIGEAQNWQNVFIFAVLSASGTSDGCHSPTGGTTNRWRTGLLARAALDSDQNEGFHGYRCGMGSDAEALTGESTGSFLQIAEFKDAPEGHGATECNEAADPSFGELARVDTEPLDLTGEDTAVLAFTAIDNQLNCELLTTRGGATAQATSTKFTSGTVGFSTLNMYGKFHFISVCEVLEQ